MIFPLTKEHFKISVELELRVGIHFLGLPLGASFSVGWCCSAYSFVYWTIFTISLVKNSWNVAKGSC
jgi:hypothetical protein